MGSSLSNLTECGPTNGGPGLGDIPGSCVACVFLYLTPPEICNLARLNRAFRDAASSDAVWDSKLPNNYKDLLLLLPLDKYKDLCKKDVFALLSRPLPFDDGTKPEVYLGAVSLPSGFFPRAGYDLSTSHLPHTLLLAGLGIVVVVVVNGFSAKKSI
ncbi:F-box protein PP2-A15-like protein [Tanacetum coccineum]